jgi:plastocyanin
MKGGNMTRITWILALLLAALALVGAGCGDDEEEGGNGAATTEESTPEPTPEPTEEPTPEATEEAGGGEALTLTADPGGAITWDPQELNAAAGTVEIELVNESSVPHAVAIEGQGVDETGETVTGGNATLSVDLEAGEYVFYCPVCEHRDNVMEGQLLVE